ncbi:MAG: DUF423 domain-containing protein [Hyphomicrobiales bacterium]|nr:DUF423 domain-containing protein [Hyphomicrobiales bacterium]MDE2113328.1 DUF423 domain-containing protein [Hyphomicrobiales bacterium]
MSLAGLMGASGVALAARAAHGTGNQAILNTAALFLIMHANALLAIFAGSLAMAALQPATARILTWCGWIMGLGACLFSADLAWRGLENASLFEGAAPTGGIAMILGWILLAVSGALIFRRAR